MPQLIHSLKNIISPKSEGARELAAFHFLKIYPQDLLLLDRGYPAHWLFRLALSIKYRLEVENFSGKSVHSVYQDFHAKLFPKNLASVVASTTKKQILKKSEKFK